MKARPSLRAVVACLIVRNVSNSVEKVDLLKRLETSFQLIILAWNIDSSSSIMRFDTFSFAQQKLSWLTFSTEF